ncbi:MAG: fumarylacetoacetate hydrolase family protein [Salaquimonas sp.]
MLKTVFPPAPLTLLPIIGSDQHFPIRRVYCVGRNYAAHAIEMGHDDREPPFFFQKNPNNILQSGVDFPYPDKSKDVHFEVELVVALKQGGKDLSLERADASIFGYAVGLDMTRRDLQSEMKKAGRPWEIGKAFEKSAPCSHLIEKQAAGDISQSEIWLDVNGKRQQTGNINQQIWNIPETISYLSQLFELAAGDIIFTGTPSGVGPVKKGDRLHAHVDGIPELSCSVI